MTRPSRLLRCGAPQSYKGRRDDLPSCWSFSRTRTCRGPSRAVGKRGSSSVAFSHTCRWGSRPRGMGMGVVVGDGNAQAPRWGRVCLPDPAGRGRRRGPERRGAAGRVLRGDGHPAGPVARHRPKRPGRRPHPGAGRRRGVRGGDGGGVPRRARPGHRRPAGSVVRWAAGAAGGRVRPDVHRAEVRRRAVGARRRTHQGRCGRCAPRGADPGVAVRQARDRADPGRCGWVPPGPDLGDGRGRVRPLRHPRR